GDRERVADTGGGRVGEAGDDEARGGGRVDGDRGLAAGDRGRHRVGGGDRDRKSVDEGRSGGGGGGVICEDCAGEGVVGGEGSMVVGGGELTGRPLGWGSVVGFIVRGDRERVADTGGGRVGEAGDDEARGGGRVDGDRGLAAGDRGRHRVGGGD